MNSEELLQNVISGSNFNSLSDSMNDFTKLYIKRLLMDIILYVDSNISLLDISFSDSYHLETEISQEIVGVPAAYSSIDGKEKVLTAFAESYSKLGIADFDALCREALLDFLNLHNGLFVVDLSEANIAELSLSVPKQSNEYQLRSNIEGRITIIPVNFTYGTVTFLLLQTA